MSQLHRPRGRPRLNNVRIECMVPRAVLDELVRREKAGQGYRTRIAANVLCTWLKATQGSGYQGTQASGWTPAQ
jgi:hypothetical protein